MKLYCINYKDQYNCYSTAIVKADKKISAFHKLLDHINADLFEVTLVCIDEISTKDYNDIFEPDVKDGFVEYIE